MDNPINGKINALEQAIRNLPAKVAVTVENFTAERFRAQNWLDRASEPWQPRKAHNRKGYTRKDGRQMKAVKVAAHSVKGFSRKINHTMPKRQFMGPSAALVKEIGRLVDREINRVME